MRTFVDFGVSLASLLREAIARGTEREYARKLLDVIQAEDRRRKLESRQARGSPQAGGLLSEREIEVLRLIAEGLSNERIAAKLVISPTTAKTHVRHIFDKLGVAGRVAAIARARELRLL